MSTGDGNEDGPREDLEDLYENAPCGYLSLQPDGRIVKINQTLLTWLGLSAAELLGKRLPELLSIAGRLFYETHFAPLLRMQGYFYEVALDLVTAEGTKLPVLANALEKRCENGELLFTRITLFQATERRRYERGLVEARTTSDATAAAMRAELDHEHENAKLREQFIAVLGHDLRNPVASISAASHLLRKELQTETSIRVLDLVDGSIGRMSGLIDDVLDFARGRLGGGLSLDRSAGQCLEPVLRLVVDELRASYPDRKIAAQFDLPEPINCDLDRIGQLASNLLANAVTHGAAAEPIQIQAKIHDGILDLWVANGGPPISSATISRLFEPFFRGEAGVRQRGLGLGLYIASEIARAHDGNITVNSNAEETRFTFTMPLI